MKIKSLKLPIISCIKCKYLKNKYYYKFIILIIKNKLNRRYKWTAAEDQLLLFWKLGVMTIKQVKSHAFLSYGIKDVMRSIFGKVCKLII